MANTSLGRIIVSRGSISRIKLAAERILILEYRFID